MIARMPSVDATGPVRARWLASWSALVVVLYLAGCASTSIPRPVVPGDAPIELVTTPYFLQRDFHCGPAALAAALGASGVPVEPADLAPYLYVPGRRGSFQAELTALPRRYERLAVPIDGSLDALIKQLSHGRPVLVLQNLALESLPRWHYAVVVGYLPDQDQLVLRSGDEPRLLVPRNRFLATWARAGRWGIVVVSPDASPEGLGAPAYLKAAAALESVGRHVAALTAFESALGVWPTDATAGLGRANNLYRLNRLPEAESAYREVLAAAPGHPVALHNLTLLLVEAGHPRAALEALPAPAPGEPALVTAARKAAEHASADSAADAAADAAVYPAARGPDSSR